MPQNTPLFGFRSGFGLSLNSWRLTQALGAYAPKPQALENYPDQDFVSSYIVHRC